jgi:hypothetical protein
MEPFVYTQPQELTLVGTDNRKVLQYWSSSETSN